MGSGTRGAAGVAVVGLLLAACGNYSTEDVRFAEALPTREDLRVAVPVQAGAPGRIGTPLLAVRSASVSATTTACVAGPATAWLGAAPAAQGMNAALDLVLGFVDAVRAVSPSWRDADARGWGPWPDPAHEGQEVRMALVRSFPEGRDAAPLFAFEFQARIAGGDAPWSTLVVGELRGGVARQGTGALTLDLEALGRLGMADAGTPQRGFVALQYDRSRTPLVIALTLDEDGFGLPRFGYRFVGSPDRGGSLAYAVLDPGGNLLVVDAAFDGAGRGRATVDLRLPGGLAASYEECWGTDACTLWLNDPLDVAGVCGSAPCFVGAAASCPATP